MLHHTSEHVPNWQESICAAANKEKDRAIQRQDIASVANTSLCGDQEMVFLCRLRPEHDTARPTAPNDPKLAFIVKELETCDFFVLARQII